MTDGTRLAVLPLGKDGRSVGIGYGRGFLFGSVDCEYGGLLARETAGIEDSLELRLRPSGTSSRLGREYSGIVALAVVSQCRGSFGVSKSERRRSFEDIEAGVRGRLVVDSERRSVAAIEFGSAVERARAFRASVNS